MILWTDKEVNLIEIRSPIEVFYSQGCLFKINVIFSAAHKGLRIKGFLFTNLIQAITKLNPEPVVRIREKKNFYENESIRKMWRKNQGQESFENQIRILALKESRT